MKLRALTILLAVLSLFLAGCDLSHKHYLDEYGICRSCGEDLAVRMTDTAEGGYTATAEPTYGSVTVYFTFVADGGDGLILSLTPDEGVIIQAVVLYPAGGSRMFLFPTGESNSGFLYDGPITAEKTYYVAVTLKTAGGVSLSVTPGS